MQLQIGSTYARKNQSIVSKELSDTSLNNVYEEIKDFRNDDSMLFS